VSDRKIDRLHEILRRTGVDVIRFRPTSHPLARRAQLLEGHGVDLVIDVGASDGDYAKELRRLGYRGRIASFEPLPQEMSRLNRRMRNDAAWTGYGWALGDEDGQMPIHVAGNSSSSSILEMLPIHERFAPGSGNVDILQIETRRLDGIANEVIGDSQRPFLKLDTQGYELRVLRGATGCLERLVGIQAELSIEPLYADAPTAIELLTAIDQAGFQLQSVEPGFSDPVTGRLLQFDGVFFRADPTRPHE
jgi:FkbM family methyltransferase